MDKVLKYKFWILAALVLPLALAGFFIASGGVKASTEERVTQLKGLNAPNPNQPNDTHAVVAKKLADQQERDNQQQLRELDAVQRQWFNWPKLIRDGLEKDPKTGQLVYRGENIPAKTLRQISVLYPEEYKNEFFRVWLSVNPVAPSGLPYSDKTKNKVFCPIEVLPFHTLAQTPKIQEMWDAQEDLWLMEMLFSAINTTNQAATNVNESAIREIMYLDLFGGSGESTVVATATGDVGGGTDYMSDSAEYMTGGEAGPAAGLGATAKFADGAIAYNPAMEYGSPASTAAACPEGASADGEYMSGCPFGGGGGAAGAKPLRYIGFDEANPGPYRKRGFYLSLLIQEKKIPDFVVNLANLDPPIYAGRWGFANNPYDEDHLLRAARSSQAGGGFAGAYESGYMGDSGGAAYVRPQRQGFGFGGGGAAYDSEGIGGAGGTGGKLFAVNDPRFPPLYPAQIAELRTWNASKAGKDLVQLEISGVVTIFTPNVPEPTPEETAPADENVPSDAPATDGTTPAAEPEAAATESAGNAEEATAPVPDAAAPPAASSDPAADASTTEGAATGS